ncbi:MAG: hypothetical protein A2085_02835 [Gemmatimonadetes bacterium GWC2_71_10]|nr:MAG: hypothetical protein A2085_02835 [Gemmatimonadetes bacterium GWC2_71_10]
MSHDAHASAAPAAPGAPGAPDDARTLDAQTPAVRDAGKILLIVLASIVAFAGIVQLFVL